MRRRSRPFYRRRDRNRVFYDDVTGRGGRGGEVPNQAAGHPRCLRRRRAAFSLFRRNALTVSLLSAPPLIPDPVALSCRTRRVDLRPKDGSAGQPAARLFMPNAAA